MIAISRKKLQTFHFCFHSLMWQSIWYNSGENTRLGEIVNCILNKWKKDAMCHAADTLPHLYGVMQGWGRRVKRQILEGLDLRCFPSSCFRPADCQHVVWKLLAEHKGWGVWPWLQYRVPLDGKICSLTTHGEREREKEGEKTKRQSGRGVKRARGEMFIHYHWLHMHLKNTSGFIMTGQALMEIELN